MSMLCQRADGCDGATPEDPFDGTKQTWPPRAKAAGFELCLRAVTVPQARRNNEVETRHRRTRRLRMPGDQQKTALHKAHPNFPSGFARALNKMHHDVEARSNSSEHVCPSPLSAGTDEKAVA